MARPADAASRIDSYLICATPRTGSSLLCGLLESTGVAGHPESYFRRPDEPSWAARWGISSPDGSFRYADFVRAAVAAGTTANGVFAARLMWGTLDEVVDKLRPFDPDPAGTDIDLLGRGFGRTRYVYLHRADVLAQAVSWLRAEQTDLWSDSGQGGGDRPEREPRFDFDGIHGLVQLIEQHNAAWRAWFAAAGVRPHPVRYEDLDVDPVGMARGVLDVLGLELPAGQEIAVRNRRLADELNARWIDRYQAELVNRSRAASGR